MSDAEEIGVVGGKEGGGGDTGGVKGMSCMPSAARGGNGDGGGGSASSAGGEGGGGGGQGEGGGGGYGCWRGGGRGGNGGGGGGRGVFSFPTSANWAFVLSTF